MNSAARACYTRNGTRITETDYQPCDTNPSHDSVCCGTNHQGAGHPQVANDVCESNGLCQNFAPYDGTNAGEKLWWRQGCTDPTWQSENCLKDVCNFDKWQLDNAPVQKCGDNSWCCGEKSCCSITSSLFVLAATVGSTSTLSLSTASKTGISTTTTTPSTARNSGTASSTSPIASSMPTTTVALKGLSTATKAGIGSGVVVALILLGIIAVLGLKLRKRKHNAGKAFTNVSGHEQSDKQQNSMDTHETLPTELHAESVLVELDVREPAELSGRASVPVRTAA